MEPTGGGSGATPGARARGLRRNASRPIASRRGTRPGPRERRERRLARARSNGLTTGEISARRTLLLVRGADHEGAARGGARGGRGAHLGGAGRDARLRGEERGGVGDGGHVVSRVEQTADARSREEELVLFAAEFLTSPFCTLFGRKFATEIPYGKNAEASNATWSGVRRFRSAKEPGNPHGSAELYSRTRGFLSEQRVVAIAFSYGYLVRLHMSPIDGACLNRAPRPSIWGSFFGKLSGGP